MSRIVRAHIGPIPFADIRWNGVAASRNVRDWKPERMTLEQFLAFVKAGAADELFFAQYVEPVAGEWDVACVFPALSFLLEVSIDARRQIGTCYERHDRAAGTTRTGLPMFNTVQFIHIEDWLPARDMIAAQIVARSRSQSPEA